MRYLGIDIGTANIKVAELSGSAKEIKLENYGILETFGYLERPNAAIQSGYFKIVEEITVDLLKKLFETMRPKTQKAFFSLPVFSSFITVFELPLSDRNEIEKAVPFEAKKYIPVPLEDLEVDWLIVGNSGSSESPKSQVLLVATPKELLEKYKKIADLAGLSAQSFELESAALVRSLAGLEKSPLLIADIGSQTANIISVDNSHLFANENLSVAGSEITHVVAQALGVSKERAEEFKRIKGFKVEPQEAEVVNLMLPTMDFLCNEMTRALNLHQEKTGRRPERVILCGGNANIPGFDEYASNYLNIKVERAWPFSGIDYDQFLEPLLRETGPILSAAVGLAKRGFQ